MKIALASQGVDLDEAVGGEDISEDLPEEVLAAERAFKDEREKKRLEKELSGEMQQFGDGLGYTVVT